MSEFTVQEIVEDIYGAEQQIKQFERKYGISSGIFYELFSQGKLDDGEYEETEELCMWAGAYEIKLDREKKFVEMSRRRVASLQTLAGKKARQLCLAPIGEPVAA
ncbi:MAG: hypothetical protein QME81_09380 [bacterium]|nr:hypothetical protein [bacterium]